MRVGGVGVRGTRLAVTCESGTQADIRCLRRKKGWRGLARQAEELERGGSVTVTSGSSTLDRTDGPVLLGSDAFRFEPHAQF
jgi:hypothetical protein